MPQPLNTISEYSTSEYSGTANNARLKKAFELLAELDPETRAHSLRVAAEAKRFGRYLGIEGHSLLDLRYAALLHDIGKAQVPAEIIEKCGPLDDSERKAMNCHSDHGFDRLKEISELRDLAHAVRHHHEHFDGTGYPWGLKGYDISFFSRIIGIIDAYDAMCSKRSYKESFTPRKARTILQHEAGSHFDPLLVKLFIAFKVESRNLPPCTTCRAPKLMLRVFPPHEPPYVLCEGCNKKVF